MTKIKICGLRRYDDAKLAASLGADFLGFVLYQKSPRAVNRGELSELLHALRNANVTAKTIGVFVDAPLDKIKETAADLDGIQLHGSESAEYCASLRKIFPDKLLYKALPTPETVQGLDAYHAVDAFLFDSGLGGSGVLNNLELCAQLRPQLSKPLILAGGLAPDNVADAIARVQPFAIDVSSRLENEPGKKDPVKMRTLFEQLRKISV